MSGATLFRTSGPSWRFEWDRSKCAFIHRTRRGTLYAILGISQYSPVWIGRWVERAYVPCDIGADTIDFDEGGCFWFGRRAE